MLVLHNNPMDYQGHHFENSHHHHTQNIHMLNHDTIHMDRLDNQHHEHYNCHYQHQHLFQLGYNSELNHILRKFLHIQHHSIHHNQYLELNHMTNLQ